MQPKKNFRKNGKESTGGCFPAAAPHNLPPSPPSGSRPVTNGTNSPILSTQGVFLLQATTASGTATRKIISKFSIFTFQVSLFIFHFSLFIFHFSLFNFHFSPSTVASFFILSISNVFPSFFPF